jgi:CubicO group peptidase (beta-lactamase class C family)
MSPVQPRASHCWKFPTMPEWLVLLSLWVMAAASCGGPLSQSTERAAPQPETLGQRLERIRAQHDLPGLAAALVQGGKPVSSAVAGVRSLGTGARLQLEDRFHIASCTKSMTATLAALLVEEGHLNWTSRLVDVVPELRDRVRPDYRGATLELLLAHAARMPAYTQFGPQRLEELKALPGSPTEQRLAFVTEVLAVEPSNQGSGDDAYSNVGYSAAAVMMERATGRSWEELIQGRLLGPLGMENVGFGWPATTRIPDQPRGHYRRDGGVVEQPLDDSYMLPIALWPAGAVNTSINDLARYAADHLGGLQGRKALLPAAAYKRLHRTLDGKPEGFTLGWGVRQDPQWGVVHYGAGSGGTFFVRITIVPSLDTAIVVASNSGDAGTATREVTNSLLSATAFGEPPGALREELSRYSAHHLTAPSGGTR